MKLNKYIIIEGALVFGHCCIAVKLCQYIITESASCPGLVIVMKLYKYIILENAFLF